MNGLDPESRREFKRVVLALVVGLGLEVLLLVWAARTMPLIYFAIAQLVVGFLVYTILRTGRSRRPVVRRARD